MKAQTDHFEIDRTDIMLPWRSAAGVSGDRVRALCLFADGEVARVSMPHPPGASAIWTTCNYDVRGWTTSVTAPDGSTTTYVYAGNTLTVADPAGMWKKYTNDAFGSLVEVVKHPRGG